VLQGRSWWSWGRQQLTDLNICLVKLRYKLKKRQVKMLRRFAQMMKWPNLAETLDNLRQRDEEFSLDAISSDAFAFFSGLVVPGVGLHVSIRQW
jgi:hypothetical protein